jgi:hypothetical protein
MPTDSAGTSPEPSPTPWHRLAGLRPTTAAWLALAAAAALLGSRDLAAQRAARPLADAGGLWISDAAIDDARRMMIVVDPATRHAAVYHVDAATGALTLRSTRDITWDLLVDDFNAQEPRPAALKRLIQAGPAATPAN